ncbi:hypothetical protein [Pedobacter frigoris]|uniref:hypothetical protein n=1 Tax=Pedobacter frigoris TaxID=2571272 RepID=UPI00145C47CD|nr:hypothetical protein [Pedobacter frigoris]
MARNLRPQLVSIAYSFGLVSFHSANGYSKTSLMALGIGFGKEDGHEEDYE